MPSLNEILGSALFVKLKRQAEEEYAKHGSLDNAGILALGVKVFSDWVSEDPDGIKWLMNKHPLMSMLKHHDEVYQYTGEDPVFPGGDIRHEDIQIVDKDSLTTNTGRCDKVFIYQGVEPLTKNVLMSHIYLEILDKKSHTCSNPDCENHVEQRWCVGNVRGQLLCKFCKTSQQLTSASCSESRTECKGCSYCS